MVNHIYQGISGLFAANKLLNTVRYRSLGRATAALLRAAYCGVMFLNRLISVCFERRAKLGGGKQRNARFKE